MGSLFGTDGIRGEANQYPIIPEIMLQVGRAAARLLKHNHRATIIIGKDTRISGDMIENALAAGICSAGGNVSLCGVLPTPAVAYLTRSRGYDAGIMVSASHNPYFDNGIKIFD
ncbi:MAG: phosphoglucosamine mutase, partial [Desulfosalsimonadaceae bacterium]